MTTLLSLLIAAAVLGGGGYAALQSPSFGALPKGARLERILASPNYREGKFQNLEPFVDPMDSMSLGQKVKVLWRVLVDRPKDLSPQDSIPVELHDLKALDRQQDLLVWFGHSGYLLQSAGVRYLVDPVFTEASPFGIGVSFFKGTKRFDIDQLPDIDYLFISHDHWDHLDYKVMKQLQPRVKRVFTGLGVGAHFERWGYRPEQIVELDWQETTTTAEGARIHFLPTQHFSGRGLKSGQSLWGSFMLEDPKHTIYIGGDSGYGKHFAEIGARFPKIDLAILENGQYDQKWAHIHTLPDQHADILRQLHASHYLLVHNSKFPLAQHSWREPLDHALQLREAGFPIHLPRIGQPLRWADSTTQTEPWWLELK